MSCGIVGIAQNITGKVVDKQGNAIQSANVALLQCNDSAFVQGVVSDAEGRFSLDVPQEKGIVKVSCLGYKTIYKNVQDANVGIIALEEDAMTLGDVIVKSSLPKSKLRNGTIITTVAGSVLEKSGSIENMLDRIPNVSSQKGKISVFGHGEPVIYINGRLVKDNTELTRLSPENISTVEVIENPGAQYASDVKAVIRINTKKTNEGLGIETKTFGEINEKAKLSGYEQLNVSYHKNKIEAFSFIRLVENNLSNQQVLFQNTYMDNTWHQRNDIYGGMRNRQLYCGVGGDCQLDNHNFVGASLNFSRTLSNGESAISTTIDNDYTVTERSRSNIAKPGNLNGVNGNAYYTGRLGKLDINLNLDWLWGESKYKVNTDEKYQEYDGEWLENAVHTNSNTRNRLLASKLTLSLPLWKGQLSFGGEYSVINRKSSYEVQPVGILEGQANRIKEGMTSVFFDYKRKIGRINILAGLSYENVNFNYHEDNRLMTEQSKRYGNILPSLSCSFPVGEIQMQLSYGSTIKRPSYHDMRTGTDYVNRYTYESGNPFLVSAVNRNVNYTMSYKWLIAGLTYTHVSDPIVLLTQAYKDNPSVAVIQEVNWKSYNRIGASFSASPKFGIWQPSLRLFAFKQWFDMETHGGHKLCHPKFTMRFDNTLNTKLCSLSLMLTAQTRGDDETSYMYRNYFSANMSVYKLFLKGRMMVFLNANNLLGTGNTHSRMYSGRMREIIHHDYSTSDYSLTIRYRLNMKKSNYKGTGAGQEQKNRM